MVVKLFDMEELKKQTHSARNQLATIRSGCEALLSDPKRTDTTVMIAQHMLTAVVALEAICKTMAA